MRTGSIVTATPLKLTLASIALSRLEVIDRLAGHVLLMTNVDHFSLLDGKDCMRAKKC